MKSMYQLILTKLRLFKINKEAGKINGIVQLQVQSNSSFVYSIIDDINKRPLFLVSNVKNQNGNYYIIGQGIQHDMSVTLFPFYLILNRIECQKIKRKLRNGIIQRPI